MVNMCPRLICVAPHMLGAGCSASLVGLGDACARPANDVDTSGGLDSHMMLAQQPAGWAKMLTVGHALGQADLGQRDAAHGLGIIHLMEGRGLMDERSESARSWAGQARSPLQLPNFVASKGKGAGQLFKQCASN